MTVMTCRSGLTRFAALAMAVLLGATALGGCSVSGAGGKDGGDGSTSGGTDTGDGTDPGDGTVSTSRGLLVIFRHTGLAAGSAYDLTVGTGTLSGSSWHGFYAASPTASGTWGNPLATFTATGLATRSF